MGNTSGIPLALLKLQFTAWLAAGSKLQPSGKLLETVTGPVKITFAVAGTGVVPLTLLMVTLKVAVEPTGAASSGVSTAYQGIITGNPFREKGRGRTCTVAVA